MSLLDTTQVKVNCPYCGEPLDILIDPTEPAEDYIEDCQVCCRPITMRITSEAGALSVATLTEDEY